MIERINELLNRLKNERIILSQAEFADKIGVKASQLSEMITGKRGVSERTIHKITAAYPDLNIDWLKTGKGTMFKTSGTGEAVEFVPLLPISAQGGSLNDFIIHVKGSDCEQVVSPIKGADFAMTVAGDSMTPEYPSGAHILIKRINERAFIDWGRVYVLDTCNGSVIKKIFPPDDKDPNKLKCVSINPEYPPFEVAFDDVFGVYRVLLCMSVK